MTGDHSPEGPPLEPHVYGLVLLLQQAAEDAARYQEIGTSARGAGDTELADWCEELAHSDREIVERARGMLLHRLGGQPAPSAE